MCRVTHENESARFEQTWASVYHIWCVRRCECFYVNQRDSLSYDILNLKTKFGILLFWHHHISEKTQITQNMLISFGGMIMCAFSVFCSSKNSHQFLCINIITVTLHFLSVYHKQTLYDGRVLSLSPPNAMPGYSDFIRGQRTVQTHKNSLSACRASTCPVRFGFHRKVEVVEERLFGFICTQLYFSFWLVGIWMYLRPGF